MKPVAAYLVALVMALIPPLAVACASHAFNGPVQTDPPGSWVWWQPDSGSYAYWTPESGIYTWATPTATTTATAAPTAHKLATPVPTSWAWAAPVIDADHGSMAVGTGFLFDIHCVLTQMSAPDAGAVYIMGFDSAGSAQPSNGTAPLFGVTSGGLSSVGNDVTYSDEQYAHGTVSFVNGFLLAVSSTADTFTAPAAGNQVRCDAKLSAHR